MSDDPVEDASPDSDAEEASEAAHGEDDVRDRTGGDRQDSDGSPGEDSSSDADADADADATVGVGSSGGTDTTADDERGDEASDESTNEADVAHGPIEGAAPDPERVPDPAEDVAASDGGTLGGEGILDTPPDDEEMPLTEHIEEMLGRLFVVVALASLATLLAFPFADDVIIRMWYDVHPGFVEACQPAPESGGCVPPHVYGPLELVLTRIRVAGLAGLLVALPLAVYQTYLFMRPGLYPHERRYYLAAVPFSLLLAVVGMVFAYFVLLPLLFTYFVEYTEGSAELAFQLADTMNLILVMMGMLAIVFQIPLLIMLAIMMGITTRQWLERRRIYFWGLFLGIAFLFGPDPTGMAPVLLTATMVVLFEATLLLLRWTGR